jgi:hypothetical protein
LSEVLIQVQDIKTYSPQSRWIPSKPHDGMTDRTVGCIDTRFILLLPGSAFIRCHPGLSLFHVTFALILFHVTFALILFHVTFALILFHVTFALILFHVTLALILFHVTPSCFSDGVQRRLSEVLTQDLYITPTTLVSYQHTYQRDNLRVKVSIIS